MAGATVRLWAAYLTGDATAVADWNGGFWDDTARAAGIEVGTISVVTPSPWQVTCRRIPASAIARGGISFVY